MFLYSGSRSGCVIVSNHPNNNNNNKNNNDDNFTKISKERFEMIGERLDTSNDEEAFLSSPYPTSYHDASAQATKTQIHLVEKRAIYVIKMC